jgi:hypothetical protein
MGLTINDLDPEPFNIAFIWVMVVKQASIPA